jgi:ribonuclease HII
MINKLLPYQTEDVLEVGIDEAGRGCLFGRVYIAGVILPNNILELCEEEGIIIKDSKKMNKKCLPYLEDIISYYFNEKNIKSHGLNNYTQKISISISKILYNTILSIDNNYRLKNNNVLLWLS